MSVSCEKPGDEKQHRATCPEGGMGGEGRRGGKDPPPSGELSRAEQSRAAPKAEHFVSGRGRRQEREKEAQQPATRRPRGSAGGWKVHATSPEAQQRGLASAVRCRVFQSAEGGSQHWVQRLFKLRYSSKQNIQILKKGVGREGIINTIAFMIFIFRREGGYE